MTRVPPQVNIVKTSTGTDTLWKIIAICTGVVIGLVILAVGIWYETRYRKRKSLLPTIVVSKEKLFHKTGNIPADEEGEEGGIKGKFFLLMC